MESSHSKDEQDLLKVIKGNRDDSEPLLNDQELRQSRDSADAAIADSLELLRSLGKGKIAEKITQDAGAMVGKHKLSTKPVLEDWNILVKRANERYPEDVAFEDLMSQNDIAAAFRERDAIEAEFSNRTSIKNKTDLSFLAIATALQVLKAQLFPFVADKFHYGESIDKDTRLAHDDPSIEEEHKRRLQEFQDKKNAEGNKNDKWTEILFRTVPYDITKGSHDLGINMEGGYHRVHTLGHDPILGWLFGTMNILTDTITYPNLSSFRVERKPKMRITANVVPLWGVFQESFETTRAHKLNLPAALCAQGAHLASDKFTKLGLPVPIIETLNENFASKLYHENYDSLCFARDAKIIGASFVISRIIDIVIGIVHGFFRNKDMPKDLYEVKTRKILLISNGIAAGSTIIRTAITANPKDLDIGSLLNFICRLFSDVRFMWRVKREFIENEIWKTVTPELEEVDRIFNSISE